MPTKGSSAWFRERRDAPPPVPAAIEIALLKQERDDLVALLRAVAKELDDDDQPPGHCHTIPGIWDRDNGVLAGQPCAWCATWERVRTVLRRYP